MGADRGSSGGWGGGGEGGVEGFFELGFAVGRGVGGVFLRGELGRVVAAQALGLRGVVAEERAREASEGAEHGCCVVEMAGRERDGNVMGVGNPRMRRYQPWITCDVGCINASTYGFLGLGD